MTEDRYVAINDIAEHYTVSISTVRAWIRDSKIPYLRVGKTFRFKLSEVDAALRDVRTKNIDDAVEELVDNPDQDI
jgi:excisionase family DNA binding protein